MPTFALRCIAAIAVFGGVACTTGGSQEITSPPEGGSFVRLMMETGSGPCIAVDCSTQDAVTANPPTLAFQRRNGTMKASATISAEDLEAIVDLADAPEFRQLMFSPTVPCGDTIDGGYSFALTTDTKSAEDVHASGCSTGLEHPYHRMFQQLFDLHRKYLGEYPEPDWIKTCGLPGGSSCAAMTKSQCSSAGGTWEPAGKCIDGKLLR